MHLDDGLLLLLSRLNCIKRLLDALDLVVCEASRVDFIRHPCTLVVCGSLLCIQMLSQLIAQSLDVRKSLPLAATRLKGGLLAILVLLVCRQACKECVVASDALLTKVPRLLSIKWAANDNLFNQLRAKLVLSRVLY